MQDRLPPNIPVELMQILTEINNNINEVKERITRIEAQDHSDSIKSIRRDLEKERDHRISLQVELANVKTKLAPIIVGISMVATVLINVITKTI